MRFAKKTFLIFVLLLFFCNLVNAQDKNERITNYFINYEINSEGDTNVTEDISVYVGGNIFKRGIFKDLKLDTSNSNSNYYLVNFAKINDQSASFNSKEFDNFKRVYIGDPNVFLTPGIYKFTLNYKAFQTIDFYEDHDEFYWNLNGGWPVTTEKLSAVIKLPENVDIKNLKVKGFIGEYGSTKPFNNIIINNNEINIVQNTPLKPNENISVAVWFPKGTFVKNNLSIFTTNNLLTSQVTYITFGLAIFLNLVSFIAVFFFYKNNGSDKKIFNPPVNFDIPPSISPAEFRFLNFNIVDSKTLTSELINLAVNKVIKIEDEPDEKSLLGINKEDKVKFTLIEKSNLLNEFQSLVVEKLFSGNKTVVKSYEAEDKTLIVECLKKISELIENKKYYLDTYVLNKRGVLPFMLYFISLCLTFVLSYNGLDNKTGPLIVVSLVLLIYTIVYQKVILNFLRSKNFSSYVLLFMYFGSLFFFIFLIPDYFGFVKYLFLLSFLPFVYSQFTNAYFNLPEKTVDLLVLINGFKKFALSQKDYLAGVETQIPLTFNMYEKYLPYALALGIETQWSSKFDEVIKNLKDKNLNPNYDRDFYLFSSDKISSSITKSIYNSEIQGDTNFYSSSSSRSSGFSSSGGRSGGGGGSAGGGGW